ncbi:MAG: Ig-like domain-containing protein [Saprospiraceae bacterium]|nr:Ig-like domain-containing protein [Saprospiraceae bacterium]
MQHRIPVFFFLILLLFACARQGAPTGGPKDSTPPLVDTSASTPNFSTNFDKKRIELKFDEWVTLSDPATQVVVSPPLAKRPEVLLKGKSVVVVFDKAEELRPNTTYTINFGTAVKDFREGNVAKDLRFVFSTGDFIDSLRFRGAVTDAFTGDPVENVSVMLYENLADTAIKKERPYYFTRTDKSGIYTFENLKAGVFRAVAIEDADQNLRWAGETERMGFADSTVILRDTVLPALRFSLFKPSPAFRVSSANTGRYGLVSLVFNTPLENYSVQPLAPVDPLVTMEKKTDSLLFWYDLPVDTAWSLVFSYQNDSAVQVLDTFVVKKQSRSNFIQNHRIGFADAAPTQSPQGRGRNAGTPAVATPQPVKTLNQSSTRNAALLFNYPVVAFDTALWQLLLDSLPQRDFDVLPDTQTVRGLQLKFNWKAGKNHTLTLLPGAVTDFWGNSNTDTLRRIFNVLSEKQMGALMIKISGLRAGAGYIFQLLNGTTLVSEQQFTAETAEKALKFTELQVAAYSIRLIDDRNGNGRWDTGDFAVKRQPEPVFGKKLDPLRANWEVEADLNIQPESPQQKKRN